MSVRPKPDGRWDIDISNGREERFRFIFPEDPRKKATQTEAKLAEMEFRRQMGLDIEVGRRTKLRHFVSEYLKWCEHHQAQRTYEKKKKILYGYILPYFGEMTWKVISTQRVNRYIDKRKTEIKSKSASQGGNEEINQEVMCLSHLMHWAYNNGHSPNKPTKFDKFRIKRRIPDVPTAEEILTLINAMEPFWKIFYSTLYFTGMRSDEIKRLRIRDINLDRKILKVEGKGSKQRLIAMNDLLIHLMEECLSLRRTNENDLVFPSPQTGGKLVSINKAIQRAKGKTGITKRIYPHLFRHSFGTHIILKGGNLVILQKQMGHADIRTTMKYVDIAFGDEYFTEVNRLGS